MTTEWHVWLEECRELMLGWLPDEKYDIEELAIRHDHGLTPAEAIAAGEMDRMAGDTPDSISD